MLVEKGNRAYTRAGWGGVHVQPFVCGRVVQGVLHVHEPVCASECASTRSGAGIRTVPKGVGCSGEAFALGQPGMGCMCGAAHPIAPTGRCVAAPAVACHGALTQLEGFPVGPHHSEPLPMLGTPLSLVSPPGDVVLGIRHLSPSPCLGSSWCDQPPAMHTAHLALPVPCPCISLLITAPVTSLGVLGLVPGSLT